MLVVLKAAVADARCSESKMASVETRRRSRTVFTGDQLLQLERQFTANIYLTRLRRIHIAQLLQLTEQQIKIWFQNRRVKYMKELSMMTEDDADDDDDVSGSAERRRHCACQRRTGRKQRP